MRKATLLPLIIACGLFVENIDSTVLATSLPAIAADLGVDPISLKLALMSYLISLAVFIPISGWVADRFGARVTFTAAIGVFMASSVACSLSNSLPMFVAARFMQGIGGAMMVPVGRLVILRSIERAGLVQALNTLTIPALVGPMLGPPLGGFITTHTSWRWIFYVNIPVGVLGMFMAWRHVPDLRAELQPALDKPGFVLSGIGLAATLLGLATIGQSLLPLYLSLGCISLGALALVGYGLHARRTTNPLLDLTLLRVPTFRIGVLGSSLFRIGHGALPFLLPLMLQLGFGLNPLQSGLITFASAVGALVMKSLSRRILRRWGFRRVLTVNAVLATIPLASCALFLPSTSHALIIGVLLFSGCLRSLQFTSINAVSYADVDTASLSGATSLASVAQQVAISLGVTLGASALQIAGAVRGGGALTVTDFHIAFVVAALIAVLSTPIFARLSANAAEDISGHRARSQG